MDISTMLKSEGAAAARSACAQYRRIEFDSLCRTIGAHIDTSGVLMPVLGQMDPLEMALILKALGFVVTSELVSLVLPNLKPRELRPDWILGRLEYELLPVGKSPMFRWIIDEPEGVLTGYVDYEAAAQRDLESEGEQIVHNHHTHPDVKRLVDKELRIAGLPPVTNVDSLTVEHVLLMGAYLTVRDFNLITGQRAHPLIRGACTRVWRRLANEAKGPVPGVVAAQKSQWSTRGYGVALEPLIPLAKREARPAIKERQRKDAEARSRAAEAREVAKAQRREATRAAMAEVLEVAKRDEERRAEAQRKSLRRKSEKDRARWMAAKSAQDAALEEIQLSFRRSPIRFHRILDRDSARGNERGGASCRIRRRLSGGPVRRHSFKITYGGTIDVSRDFRDLRRWSRRK